MNLHDIPTEKPAIRYSGIYDRQTGLFWIACETTCKVCNLPNTHEGGSSASTRYIYDHYGCAQTEGDYVEDVWVCDCEICYTNALDSESGHTGWGRYAHYYEENYDDEDPDVYQCYRCENGNHPVLPREISNGLS